MTRRSRDVPVDTHESDDVHERDVPAGAVPPTGRDISAALEQTVLSSPEVQIPAPSLRAADRAPISAADGGPTSEPLLGTVVGDFEIVEHLGSGSFGDVYRAWQGGLGREAVVKVARNPDAREDTAERFLQEARLASQLDHPYAAHIYSFGHDPTAGRLWIAMEYIRGVELGAHLRDHHPLPLEELVDLFERICEVVHTAHEMGIVHRDLKPANIMLVERAGRRMPKLLDFGVAKLQPAMPPRAPHDSDEPTAAGLPGEPQQISAIVGTPAYMSPEQWRNSDAVDARSDIYALGVILFEAFTGKRPFNGRSLLALQTAHCHDPVPAMPRELPAAVADVVARALAKDADERFTDALVLSSALADAAGLGARDAFVLPRQASHLRERWIGEAPQPIAESLALLRGARSAREARELILTTGHAMAQYLGLLALSAASRVGWSPVHENPRFADAVVEIGRRGFTALDWLRLAREVVRPFVDRRPAFPLPPLVELFFDEQGDELLLPADARELLERSSSTGSRADDTPLGAALTELGELMVHMRIILQFPVVVLDNGLPELWIGTHKTRRQVAMVRQLPADGRATLFNMFGAPLVELYPFMQVAAPSPGEPNELFFLDGIEGEQARLVALPAGYQLREEVTRSQLGDLWRIEAGEGDDAPDEARPFPGLAAFRAQDARFFVGRERESNEVRNQLRNQAFVAVVGASGSGKSSFVQAGIMAQLAPEDWYTCTVRPGAEPLYALVDLLEALAPPEDGASWAERLSARPESFGDGLRSVARERNRHVLVLIDQLEELFTLSDRRAARMAFAQAVMSATRSPRDPVRIVVTLRDDFLARAEQLTPFTGKLGQKLRILTTPDEPRLRRIITEPVQTLGYAFEDPAMVDDILADVVGRPGSLPLLSFAAAELWALRDRHFKKLPRGAYAAIGGVAGSLAAYADRLLEDMAPAERRLVREAFRHLVTAEGTRAVVVRSELLSALDPDGTGAGTRVLERLLQARLLVAGEGERGEQIEVVHEALLTAWPRLVAWRREDSDGHRMHDQLRTAARQWVERGRPRGLLWRGDALAEYKVWRARFAGSMTAQERTFAQTSLAEESRGRRLRRLVIAGILLVLAGALAAVLWMYRETQEQLYASYEDSGRRELVAGRPVQALELLSQARAGGRNSVPLRFALAQASNVLDRIDRTLVGHQRTVFFGEPVQAGKHLLTTDASGWVITWDSATGGLLERFRAHDTGITRFVVADDEATLLTSDANGVVRLWDAASKQRRLQLIHDESITTLRISADGRHVATKTESGVARLWDARTGQAKVLLPKNRSYPNSGNAVEMAFCADEQLVLVGSGDGQLHAFSIDGAKMWSIRAHEDSVENVGCLPQYDLAYSAGGDRYVRLWQLESRQQRHEFSHPSTIARILRDPSEQTLVTIDTRGAARLWKLQDGRLAATLDHRNEVVLEAAFDDTGERILTVGRTVALWRVSEPAIPEAVFPDLGGKIRRARFLDEERLFTLSEDSSVRIWRRRDSRLLGMWRPENTDVWTLSVSPSGTRVALGFGDPVGRVYDQEGRLEVALRGHEGPVGSVVFDGTGRRLATGSDDKTVRIWSRDGQLQRILRGHEAPITSVRFSPDDARVLSASWDGTARIWDAASGDAVRVLRSPRGQLNKALWGADGQRVYEVNKSPAIAIWDATTGEQLSVIEAHGMKLNALAVSPDGRFLATSGEAATGTVWDARTGEPVALLEGHSSYIYAYRFCFDGGLLASMSADQMLMFWEPSTGKLVDRLDLRTQMYFFDVSARSDVFAVVTSTGLVRVIRLSLESRGADELAGILTRHQL